VETRQHTNRAAISTTNRRARRRERNDLGRDGAAIPSQVYHHPRRHAAVRTDEYLYSQLIPYIGNKRKLLPLISRGIALGGRRRGVFVDLFTGSTVVARLAKTMGFRVVANDWEPYSYEIARATVALNRPPAFEALGGPGRVFERLNRLRPRDGYVARHLCPEDDDHPDPDRERMFFTRDNGGRIDAIRERIETWERQGKLSEDERAYLLAALVYAVSYVSNTSGVFKGFHYGWGGKTETALYRILSTLQIRPPTTFDNRRDNVATRHDAQVFAGQLSTFLGRRPDVVYLDPPYNQHPYGSNYHVLNTVVLWDKPPLHPKIRVNGRKHDKSAIRKDWRTQRRSPYHSTKTALPAFRSLLDALDARRIVVSYSTDGNMTTEDLLTALAERGAVTVLTQRYKRYRVSTPRMSPRSHNVEFVAVLDPAGKPCAARADELTARIRHQVRAATADAQPRDGRSE
jgi:adenine-specific DNA-methyltransferase